MRDLILKYNRAVPRYTSYPTVPQWTENFSEEAWQHGLAQQLQSSLAEQGLSLYVHLPFCESLCTYCGCNKKITRNHAVEEDYLDALEKEWNLYLATGSLFPALRELHLGGGTPTFFHPKNLKQLVSFLVKGNNGHPNFDGSVEGHPNNTSWDHLAVLAELGFRRVSLGVQDNDAHVQHLINRIQPFENVVRVTRQARDLGYTSINFDLIYGLPGQTESSMSRTFEEVLTLRPNRIAFYSYAHVPWTSRGQRLFDERDLPGPEKKLNLYLTGKSLLTSAGYGDIGMDHFALPGDDLFAARQEGTLHRNFMGYTTQKTSLLLGLGVSSIGDIHAGFAQNQKTLGEYYSAIRRKELPVFKGLWLTAEDQAFRQYILAVTCQGKVRFNPSDLPLLSEWSFPVLQNLADDGLVIWNEQGLEVTGLGQHFIRNIASAFDLYLQRQNLSASPKQYSQAI